MRPVSALTLLPVASLVARQSTELDTIASAGELFGTSPILSTAPPELLENVIVEHNLSSMDFDNHTVVNRVANDTTDSLLDLNDTYNTYNTSAFLSFEEWRTAKGADTPVKDPQVQPRPKSHIQSGYAIGEEMEIDIAQFFPQEEDQEPEGKLYSNRFNFASFDCAATIVKTNSEAKGAVSILVENKDSYLLNPCSAPNKFVVVEMCQDILVDSVVLANYEFFSSTFKKIRLSVSESFPVASNGWKLLGEFSAKDIRDVQEFNITNPMIWAKYFRVEILEHYGNEYYCPLSVVRVHGRTMMQEYKQEEAKQQELKEKTLKEQEIKEVLQTNHTVVVCDEEQKVCNTTEIGPLEEETNEALWNVTSVDNCPVTLPSIPFHEFFLQVNSTDSSLFCPTTPPSVLQTSTAQESIYKNIMKRLSQLEANATLSVLYIEEQSKLISSAFALLESRHRDKVENLMSSVNSTIQAQVAKLSELYINFQARTDEVLVKKAEQHHFIQSETQLRLSKLEADTQSQKLVTVFNAMLLFCIFFYVILTRETTIETEYDDVTGMGYRSLSSLGFRRLMTSSDEDDEYSETVTNEERLADPGDLKRPMTPPSDRE